MYEGIFILKAQQFFVYYLLLGLSATRALLLGREIFEKLSSVFSISNFIAVFIPLEPTPPTLDRCLVPRCVQRDKLAVVHLIVFPIHRP